MHLPHSLVVYKDVHNPSMRSEEGTRFTADRHNRLVNAAFRYALMHAKHECLENIKTLVGPVPAEIRLSGQIRKSMKHLEYQANAIDGACVQSCC